MNNNILIGLIVSLILFSVYLVARNELQPASSIKNVVARKVSTVTDAYINLDSGFNNFKDNSALRFDRLHCELYEELTKHVDLMGKVNPEEHDSRTSQLLMSLIKEINRVKSQKKILMNLPVMKPNRISMDTTKLQRLYSSLVKAKNVIDNREGQIQILKDNFRPSVVSGKQWEIEVEKQLINYWQKRLDYLKSLNPKSTQNFSHDNINKIGDVLSSSKIAIDNIIQNFNKNKNMVKYDEQINKVRKLEKYWELRLEEVKKCQKTDEGYRKDTDAKIYQQLDELGKAQKERKNTGYCLELRRHLVLKLIREFDAIQSDFNCFKEKSRVEAQLKKLRQDAEKLENQKSRSDPNPNKNDDDLRLFNSKYNDINTALESGVRRLEVGYDAKTLSEMIANTEDQLRKHRDNLNSLQNNKLGDDVGDDPNKIIKLTNLNNEMKSQFCKEYQQYEHQNQRLRGKIDQITAQKSAQHIATERYLIISNQIRTSLAEIGKIKDIIKSRLSL